MTTTTTTTNRSRNHHHHHQRQPSAGAGAQLVVVMGLVLDLTMVVVEVSGTPATCYLECGGINMYIVVYFEVYVQSAAVGSARHARSQRRMDWNDREM